MKKKLLHWISRIIFVLCCTITISCVKAESFKAGEYVSRIYVKKENGNNKRYLRMQWINRTSDNKFVYCLEPWVDLDEAQNYEELVADFYSLDQDILTKINLLSYYGYGYDGHEDEIWYAITQLLIWRAVDPDSDFYFTDVLNGNRINIFEEEIAELEQMVIDHYTLPSFAVNTIIASLNKDTTIIDENNVLYLYEIRDPNNVIKNIEENKIIINSNRKQQVNIDLVKKSNKYENIPIVYINNVSQDLYLAGAFNEIGTNFSIEFVPGTIKLIKKDSNTLSLPTNKFITLENAIYGVYDENQNLVEQIITDNNGYGSISNLPLGNYTIKEIASSEGYTLDNTEYQISLSSDNYEQELIVYEKPITKQLEIYKQYLDSNTKNYYPEQNVEFLVYNATDNSYVGKIITNEDGKGYIDLEYGKYIIKQNTSKEGYDLVADFEITIDKNTESKITKELINYPIKVDVKLPNTNSNEMNMYIFIIILIIWKLYDRFFHKKKNIK